MAMQGRGDSRLRKVFVGGLAWETGSDSLRRYFLPFGDILEAVVITDATTARSKGYGFVTFRDPESASRACADPFPVIDGRRTNCNLAALGRNSPAGGFARPRASVLPAVPGNYGGGATFYTAPLIPYHQQQHAYPYYSYGYQPYLTPDASSSTSYAQQGAVYGPEMIPYMYGGTAYPIGMQPILQAPPLQYMPAEAVVHHPQLAWHGSGGGYAHPPRPYLPHPPISALSGSSETIASTPPFFSSRQQGGGGSSQP